MKKTLTTSPLSSVKLWLSRLSFRTGVIVLLLCIPFYIASFAQMLLPLSVGAKSILWAALFGTAKAFQYSGLAILGAEGYRRLKRSLRKRGKEAGLPAVRLIIFDFDGTLGDSQKLITDTMLATIDRLGLEKRSREECARTIGLPLAKCFSSMIPMTDGQAEHCAQTYREIFDQKNVAGAVQPFPGVIGMLKQLAANGYILSIASSRSHRSLADFVDQFGLQSCFSYLVGADDVIRHKPEAEPVTKTLNHFGLQAGEAVVVGDTAFDIEMGRNAGTLTCGVDYGNGTREELRQAGADGIISHISELASEFLPRHTLGGKANPRRQSRCD
ncbi:HAD family hydrolase [Prevotella dentasini]|uniref:HAD family hydrolase n=1 Tax=Prevotella dentasini TaxID=589537 RepID=UPI000A02EB13|nr:HAD family hydrolase [Prevotella dentasini]